MSVMVSQITRHWRVFVKQYLPANITETKKGSPIAILTLCRVMRIHRQLVDSPEKGPVMRKVFPLLWRHDVNGIMLCSYLQCDLCALLCVYLRGHDDCLYLSSHASRRECCFNLHYHLPADHIWFLFFLFFFRLEAYDRNSNFGTTSSENVTRTWLGLLMVSSMTLRSSKWNTHSPLVNML